MNIWKWLKVLFVYVALVVLWACLLAAGGCTVIEYAPGQSFKMTSILNRRTIQSLQVQVDTNGVRSIQLEGYQSDQVEALKAGLELGRSLAEAAP